MKNLSRIASLIGSNHRVLVATFFVAYFFIGTVLFKDYGISWNELVSRLNGVMALNYVVHGDVRLFEYKDKYYGPIFEILLVAIEAILNLTQNTRALFLMRHLVTFLMFYVGVVFFYILVRNRFNSWKMGLLGCLFMILSPRIFAHSFYNSKDIVFLALFIISTYTMICCLNKRSLMITSLHALVSALLIDVRIMGVMIPLFTIYFLTADFMAALLKWKNNGRNITVFNLTKETLVVLFAYIVQLYIYTVFFWPTLWPNPAGHFVDAFFHMSKFPWPGNVLYLGDYIKGTDLPWHYIPLWILISTPVLYSVLFFIGIFVSFRQFLIKSWLFMLESRDDCIFLLGFFLPLAAIILLKSTLYDEWRQMLFIYPSFLMIALIGLNALFQRLIKIKHELCRKIAVFLIAATVFLSLASTYLFMAKNHPFQNVYFNFLAGTDMQDIKGKFELDYWGLSYRKALEYILRTDQDDAIKIYVANGPGIDNAKILQARDRERLVYVESTEEAKYFLSNYREHNEEYPYEHEYYSIKVGNAKIMVVYKLK